MTEIQRQLRSGPDGWFVSKSISSIQSNSLCSTCSSVSRGLCFAAGDDDWHAGLAAKEGEEAEEGLRASSVATGSNRGDSRPATCTIQEEDQHEEKLRLEIGER